MTQQNPEEALRSEDEDVAAAYDRWAAIYDDNRNATRDLDTQIVRKAPLRLRGRDVLEIGCGTGKNTIWLASEARSVVAMDFSSGMIAVARQRVQSANVNFVEHDVRVTWPLADGGVDVVVGNLVLEHVEDLTPIFTEAARVLRPGGQLFLCELHPYRQFQGTQANFTDVVTGDVVYVAAFPHLTSDYVNAGIAVGLTLRELGEWIESDPPPEMPPRLLSVLFDGKAGA